MNTDVKNYIEKFSDDVKNLFSELRTLIFDSVDKEIEEKLWAKIPSYYVNENFIRLISFKDHINVEAKSIEHHKEELKGYKLTPKGMLQIYLGQDIPSEALKQIFTETLSE
ncbi:MAG: DUF1801 domain-containing protein [Ruminococcaceae bacterium]|nr:DUF1801 domain-containing protein [Oscillospiraceae bacterium]